MTPGPRPGPGVPVGHLARLGPPSRPAEDGPTLALATVEDTKALGARLAGVLRAGDVLVLVGPLGAGKTALVQGIGAGLGVQGRIASPTFVIARVHPGGAERRLPLIHVDAYRLGSAAEVDDLDLDLDVADAVTVIEWGEGLVEQLADARLEVRISRAGSTGGADGPDGSTDGGTGDTRQVRLVPHGGDWAERLTALAGLTE